MNEPVKINKEIVGWKITGDHDDSRRGAIEDSHAPKRPLELECEIHKANVRNDQWTIIVGMLDGRPYEVMGGLSEYIDIPNKYSDGSIMKRPRKTMNAKYDLKFGESGSEVLLKDVVAIFDNPNYGSLTRMISMSLRHGVPVQYIVEQLQKDKSSDMFSFSRVISRVLKKYIKDGCRVGNGVARCNCENHEESNFIYQSGCVLCTTCGYSACG
tara:strand:+ start:119555 stop:120193 length:639 start_codon:yes stop_codon:yes gene_type:complete